MKSWIQSALAAAFLIVGLAQAAQAVTNKEIVANVARNVVLQTYVDLANKAADLYKATQNFASNPTQENLDTAKLAWKAARAPWESSEAFLYGPVDSLGIDPRLDTWPLNRVDLEGVLNSGRKIDEKLIEGLGSNLQGFHTVEYLLFGNGLKSNNKELSAFDQQQLNYLVSTAYWLARYTHDLGFAWSTQYNPEDTTSTGYVDVIANPGLQNPFYSSERSVLEEYINGMIAILDEVANGKIADPFGSDANHANVELVESPYSWNSLLDFQHNILSVYNVYTGTYGDHKGAGVRDFVKAKDVALAQRVEFEILKSMQLIQKVSGPNGDVPFRYAILDTEGRKRIQLAIEQLNKTRTLMEERVLPLLD